MPRNTIRLFMWGYQVFYRRMLELHAKNVFKKIGLDITPKVLLVGVLAPGQDNVNPICIEPEDGEWPLNLFDNLLDSIESTIKAHPQQNVFYSNDERSTRDKPEVIRRDSVNIEVYSCLIQSDIENNVRSFCTGSYEVSGYYVVPVIQIPNAVFEKYPALEQLKPDSPFAYDGYPSFIHACIFTLLAEAIEELRRVDPGRSGTIHMRQSYEIVRNAATSFMHTPGTVATNKYAFPNLFERFNLISSLMYEGAEGTGHLLLVNQGNTAINFMIEFNQPISFSEPRWARKILQLATNNAALIADSNYIYGLGKLRANHSQSSQDVFIIDFIDHYHWELKCAGNTLLASHYGEPRLPQETISSEKFKSNYARLFPESSPEDQDHLWSLFNHAICLKHGNMIVVASDALSESQRLTQQGTIITPTLMTKELLSHVSNIDGTIILDPHGTCYAIGVILDGAAIEDCTPSRGSRYNSGLRYVNASDNSRLAIVISDDNTVDIIPILRPQIRYDDIELNICMLENATLDDYHIPQNWLDKNRFYCNQKQCMHINSALERIEALEREPGEFFVVTNRFQPDSRMNDSYFLS